jgi:hypothetical protein
MSGGQGGRVDSFKLSTADFESINLTEDSQVYLFLTKIFRLFGLCYAMDGGYKGWNPYLERHLAIFVNCF